METDWKPFYNDFLVKKSLKLNFSIPSYPLEFHKPYGKETSALPAAGGERHEAGTGEFF